MSCRELTRKIQTTKYKWSEGVQKEIENLFRDCERNYGTEEAFNARRQAYKIRDGGKRSKKHTKKHHKKRSKKRHTKRRRTKKYLR